MPARPFLLFFKVEISDPLGGKHLPGVRHEFDRAMLIGHIHLRRNLPALFSLAQIFVDKPHPGTAPGSDTLVMYKTHSWAIVAVGVNSEHYARQAEYCRSMAAQVEKPDLKEGWLNLADAWLQMIPPRDREPSREDGAAAPAKKARHMIWPG